MRRLHHNVSVAPRAEIVRILRSGSLLADFGTGLLRLRSWFSGSHSKSSSDQRDSAMSDPSSVGPEKSSPPKKPISPARNIAGLVILAAVLVVCWFEYSAVLGFNAAVKALETRTQNEEQSLASVTEAEELLGKAADGPAEEFKDGPWNFNKKTYTWKGVLKQHTLTAYYTKEQVPLLHHFETEGSKYDLKANQPPIVVAPAGGGGDGAVSKGGRNSGSGGGGAPADKSKAGDDAKAKSPEPSDKDKAATPKAEPADNAATPKAVPTTDKAAGGAPQSRALRLMLGRRRNLRNPAPRANRRSSPIGLGGLVQVGEDFCSSAARMLRECCRPKPDLRFRAGWAINLAVRRRSKRLRPRSRGKCESRD